MTSGNSAILSDFESDADMALLGGDFDKGVDSAEVQNTESGGEETAASQQDADGDQGKATTIDGAESGKGSDGDDSGAAGTPEDHEAAPIPRARFNEVNSKLKEEREARERLEARILELEQAATATQQPATGHRQDTQDHAVQQGGSDKVILDLERQYQEAIFEADDDKALEIRAQINAEVRRLAKEEALQAFEAKEQEKSKRAEADQAQALLQEAADELVKTYPILNTDQDKVAEVVEWRDFLISTKRIAPHEALKQAAVRVCGAPDATTAKSESKVDQRTADAVQRGLADSRRQPPTGEDGIGVRATGVGAKTPESQSEYERLPQKEREKLLM